MDNTIASQLSGNELESMNALLAELDESGETIEATGEDAPQEEVIEEPEDGAVEETVLAEADEELAELNDVLEDLPIEAAEPEGEEVEAEAEAAPAVEDNTELDDDELRDLDLAIEKQAAYQAQTAAAVVTVEKQEPGKAKTKSATGNKRGSSVPRAARDLNGVAPEFFVLSGDPATMDQAALDQAKTDTIALKPGQVKIAEKFENLFTTVAAGCEPSGYTVTAFKLLDANKKVTSADIIAAYKSAGLGEGTARSQTGQLMNLFNAVKIANRTGNALELREDSLLADRIRKILNPAPAA